MGIPHGETGVRIPGYLINTRIGLRHLCDWAVFMAKFSDEDFCEMMMADVMNGGNFGVKDMIAGATEQKEIYKEFRLFEAE